MDSIGKVIAEIVNSQAYKEGYHDAMVSLPLEDNPYEDGMWSDDYMSYRAGWFQGDEEKDDPI